MPTEQFIHLEVAVFSAADALRAAHLRAARIELNAPGSYPHGGLTPSLSDVRYVSARLGGVPLRVMIRPSVSGTGGAGGFVYTDAEFTEMCAAIDDIVGDGALDVDRGDGFVFGVLEEDSELGRFTLDRERCRELVRRAGPLVCVLHRAVDYVLPPIVTKYAETTAIIDAIVDDCGFGAVLTAGGVSGGCADNLSRLGEVATCAARRGLQLVCGGGVRHHNVEQCVWRLRHAVESVEENHVQRHLWVHSAAWREGLDEQELCLLLGRLRAL